MDCLFCKLVDGTINSNIIYQDEEIIAFDDINPQAPIHVLVIPKRHISTINDLTNTDALLAGKMILAAKQLATTLNLTEGYRLVFNCEQQGGQQVYHIHLHLLGGRQMMWPPG